MPTLSLVIPLYNEEGNVADLVREITAALPAEDLELILVDDCSTDATVANIPHHSFIRLLEFSRNRGQSAAMHAGIMAATAVAIAATLLQIGYLWRKNGFVEPMQWVSLFVIAVFGGATLLTQDETFIKWKPSILYWAMGTGFLIAKFFGKNPIRAMMKGQVEMPDFAWNTLLYTWVGFFALMGAVNIFVAYNFSTDVWVDFKLFGSLGATLIFIFAQGFYMSKHMKPETQGK